MRFGKGKENEYSGMSSVRDLGGEYVILPDGPTAWPAHRTTVVPGTEAKTTVLGPAAMEATTPAWKYEEERLLREFREYIESTYSQHYVGEDNVQSLDLIFATKRGEGFCVGNVMKYAARHGKKKGAERLDLLKAMHYAMLALYDFDKRHR